MFPNKLPLGECPPPHSPVINEAWMYVWQIIDGMNMIFVININLTTQCWWQHLGTSRLRHPLQVLFMLLLPLTTASERSQPTLLSNRKHTRTHLSNVCYHHSSAGAFLNGRRPSLAQRRDIEANRRAGLHAGAGLKRLSTNIFFRFLTRVESWARNVNVRSSMRDIWRFSMKCGFQHSMSSVRWIYAAPECWK